MRAAPLPAPATRRASRREQTVAEIKARALEQVTSGGAESLSLNAVGRAMGLSPTGIYRYFASRDELLAELVVDAYASLADVLEAALEEAAPDGPRQEDVGGVLRRLAAAYRGWALEHPHAYRLALHTRSGSGGELAPERTVPAAQRGMDAFLTALGAVPPARPAPDEQLDAQLAGQLGRWGARAGAAGLPPSALHLAVATWSRLHGLVSLELGGHLAAMGLDGALLLEAEVDALLAALEAPAPGPVAEDAQPTPPAPSRSALPVV